MKKSFSEKINIAITKMHDFGEKLNFNPLKKVINWVCDLLTLLITEELSQDKTEEEPIEEIEKIIQEQLDLPEANSEEEYIYKIKKERGFVFVNNGKCETTIVDAINCDIGKLAITIANESGPERKDIMVYVDVDKNKNRLDYFYYKNTKELLQVRDNDNVYWIKEGFNPINKLIEID